MSESIHKSERKPQAAHLCCVCLRDITGKRRVKDPKGRYFCKRCYKVGQLRKHKLAKRRLAAVPNISASSDLHLTLAHFTLDDLPVTGQSAAETIVPPVPLTAPLATATFTTPFPSRPRPRASAPPPSPATSSLPTSTHCTLCIETLPPNQRVCNDCAAELPKLNNLFTLREEHTNQITRHNRRLKTLKTLALAAIPVALASIALISFGRWFTPQTPYTSADQFPTTRAQAIEQLLADIQDGSGPAYENALHLLSSNTRQSADATKDQAYKSAFKLMHDDFLQKYGQRWLALAQVDNLLPDLDTQFIPFSITIHNDVYHITSQALAPTDVPAPTLHFPENGKQHFAISQIEEYAVLPDASVAHRDPLKLHDDPLSPDLKFHANTLPPGTPPDSQ